MNSSEPPSRSLTTCRIATRLRDDPISSNMTDLERKNSEMNHRLHKGLDEIAALARSSHGTTAA